MKIDGDPAYIWIIVASVISCMTSLVIILKIINTKKDWNKLFHQLSFAIASADIVQCVSW